MERENSTTESLEEIKALLSQLQGEVTCLEHAYSGILEVLRRFEGACDLDDLTGLLRRRPFFQKFEELLEACRRAGENCGVLMIDIDHFKRINDQHGHPTGDQVIQSVAKLLKQFESAQCVAGRYGGEEFAVAVRGQDAEILGLAEFIRRGAERLHGPVVGAEGQPSSAVHWKCTLSVGMASGASAGLDAARLIRAADEALYEAKRRGRNQVSAA